MKKRLYTAIAAVIAAVTLGAVLAAVPARAAATNELKTDNGASSLCMNRGGGGTSNNTPVIAYNCGDNNNDFYFGYLTTMCGSGTVTTTCPFTNGSGLNLAFYNDPIVVAYAYNEHKCVGGANSNDPSAKLEGCPADNGSGGGWSTIGVLAYSKGNDPPYYFIVNRNWSNYNYTVGHQCYGLDCSAVIGAFGYTQALALNTADSGLQNGQFGNPNPDDVWGEVSY